MALSRLAIRLRRYLRRNPARVYSFCVALAAFISRMHPEIPTEVFVVVVLAILGVGNRVQTIEDRKTIKALYMTPPRKRKSNPSDTGNQ